MYSLTDEQKAENAIKWIEAMPNYRKGESILDGVQLGRKKETYSCLGAGCEVLGIEFDKQGLYIDNFKKAVGLKELEEGFIDKGWNLSFDRQIRLLNIYDVGEYCFKLEASIMKKNPNNIFENEVAEIITKHFA